MGAVLIGRYRATNPGLGCVTHSGKNPDAAHQMTRTRARKSIRAASLLIAASLVSAVPLRYIADTTEHYCAARISYEPMPGVVVDAGSVCAAWPLLGAWPVMP